MFFICFVFKFDPKKLFMKELAKFVPVPFQLFSSFRIWLLPKNYLNFFIL